MREIEVKLKVPDLKLIEKKLIDLGCSISLPKTQKDINFIHKDDVKWFESEKTGEFCYPRLRIQTNKPLIFTVKKPLKNEMDCLEHEFTIDNEEELRGAMKLLNYIEGVTVEKTRRNTKYGDYTITLDEVVKLGSFIEIERVVEDGDSEKIQKDMFVFAKENFGLDPDEQVMKGYDILMYYFDKKGNHYCPVNPINVVVENPEV